MAYIVKQKVHGKDYYYLRKSVRSGNKVVSKSIAYLGKDKEQAEKKAKEILNVKKQKQEQKGSETLEKPKYVKISIEELANFCKAKGFVFRSSDIYGGFSGFWDFGPLGVELFKNIKRDWWDFFVYQKENVVGIEASVISSPMAWKASGHITSFKDVAVICKKCGKSTKLEISEFGKINCDCGGEYEKIGEFNLLFKTNVGALDTEEAYLRGETAQAMFMNFKLVSQTSRMQLPFGIAQVGRCFRNEIAPRDFLFRSREFNIGELEFFISPGEKECNLLKKKHLDLKIKLLDAEMQKSGKIEFNETNIKKMLEEKRLGEWHAYWLAEQIFWFKSLGLENIKVREHMEDERAFYSSATFDIDYNYNFGSKEIAGIANRGQYDLGQHQTEAKKSMEIFDEKSGKKVLPRVIEPTFGMERVFLAILTSAYSKNSKGDVVLRIPPKLAPIKAAVFPIVKKPKFEKIAENIVSDLRKEYNVVYDRSGSIGRRYARNDEIGTPFCITIDESSLETKDVTVRIRDTTEQVRIKIDKLKEVLKKIIAGEDILNFGKKINTRKKI